MKTTIYKAGGKTRVWNTTAYVKVIAREDLAKYLAEGWLDHPSKLFESPPEQEETETGGADLIGEGGEAANQRRRQHKAATGETDN